MTILFLSRLFYPHIGGVEKHVFEISKRLVEKGYKVVVITEQHEKRLRNKEKIDGIYIFRIPVGKSEWLRKFRIWIWLFKNKNLIQNADIVHVHDVFFWYFPFRFIFPKKKVFTTFHGYEGFPISRKAILQRGIAEGLSFGNICVGSFIKKWYGTKPTYVTYGGAEISNVKRQISDKPKKESAVFVGRLDEQTGIQTYLEAVKRIKKKIPNFKLTIFGDGKFRDLMPNYVDFRGFKKNASEELGQYNFVFTSRYLSILEAMAAKRLVIAVYDNPIKKDYLKMSPFAKHIIIVNSANKIAEKVINLLAKRGKQEEIIESAFEWVKNHTWNNVANLYLSLWGI